MEVTDNVNNGVKTKKQHPVFTFFIAAICAVILTGVISLAVFALAVRGSEEVLVPDVVGKELTSALQEMQVKELYPRLVLRYSDSADEKGRVLEQNPVAGSIVKAGRRITLTVSRGYVATHVPDYTGELLDFARLSVKSMTWADGSSLITIADPMYKTSNLPEGTIISQEPAPSTPITDAIEMTFVVSKGNGSSKTTVPDLTEKSVSDVLAIMEKTKLIFDFTSHIALEGEKAGSVTAFESFEGKSVKEYTHVAVDFAFPDISGAEEVKSVYGIFEAEITEYPYPVPMTLTATSTEGETITIASFMHKGGKVTIPYAAANGSRFTLSAPGKEITQ